MRARKTDRNSGQSGFTLVELLIVVALISILATLALPYFDHYRHKAAVAAAQGTAHCLETGFTGFDPASSDPAERLPLGVISQASLIDAGTQVGCKMASSGLISAVYWKDCQMIFICPDGREISATCSADPDVVCGNGPPIRSDYLLTLAVPRYGDTVAISSREQMLTRIVTTSIPTPIPTP
jgi:prepilin-type N-terminal cleavage/methylation domain-containing protein